jgi:alpha-beta hydrolase superfamily lysophospholipase
MTAETYMRTARDGTRLFTHHWPHPAPVAAIVVVHGLGEHLGRYEHIGPQFVARGYDVRGTDTRGYGASEGPRAWTDSFDTLLDDIADDMGTATELGVPVILLGHSLGGLEALIYATSTGRPLPDLLVLSAPAIHNSLPSAQVIMARILARIVPRMTLKNPVDPTQLSSDQSVGERYVADPLVVQKSSFGFGTAVFSAFDRVPAAMAALSIPTLVTHGGLDRIVAPSVSEPLGDLPPVDRIVWPAYRHEGFNEDGGVKAVDTIDRWIRVHLAAA